MDFRRYSRRRVCLGYGAGLGAVLALPGKVLSKRGDKPLVITTLPQLAASLDALLNGACRLDALVPPQGDPHAYRLSRSDIAALDRASAVVSIGFGLEAAMAPVLARLARDKPVIALADQLPRSSLRHFEGSAHREHGRDGSLAGIDPHIWLDPALWATALAAAVGALHDKGIIGGAAAETNGYSGTLRDLAAAIQQRASALPSERRVIVTAHDSLGYFGRRFGFDTYAARGAGALGATGVKRIERLTDLVVERRVPVLFREIGVNDQPLRSIRDAAARRGHRPRLSEPLRIATSNLAAAGGYVAMMKTLSEKIIGGLELGAQ